MHFSNRSYWRNPSSISETGQHGQQEQLSQRMMDATHPTFKQTVKRHKCLYPCGFVLKTLVRWVLNDPDYQTQLRYLSRAINPADYDGAKHLTENCGEWYHGGYS
jgi:hypothetical protein